MRYLINLLVDQSRKNHSPLVRGVATLLGGTLFLAVFPVFVLWAGRVFGCCFILPVFFARIVSVFCLVMGAPWLLSSIFWQLSRGKGTPVPVIPTKHFLSNGPYLYVRNPMMLGFFLYLLGWVFKGNTIGALAAGILIIALLVMFMKFVEEPELEARFGSSYLEYKRNTPFILPKFPKK